MQFTYEDRRITDILKIIEENIKRIDLCSGFGAFSSAAQRPVGAVAVAQGAGDIAVRLNLTQALMRLLDLDAQSVLVLTMEEGTR